MRWGAEFFGRITKGGGLSIYELSDVNIMNYRTPITESVRKLVDNVG